MHSTNIASKWFQVNGIVLNVNEVTLNIDTIYRSIETIHILVELSRIDLITGDGSFSDTDSEMIFFCAYFMAIFII